jgi:simple sugar transport system ATP-binding protein
MGILFGLYDADSGKILVRGKEVRIGNPNVANGLGIGMVHQHFKLVHNFTVTENIILGHEPRRGLVTDIKSAATRVKEISERYGLNVDPYARIEDISVGMQQRVEILKMLYRNADVLIFDEPTAVLTPQEVQGLTDILRNLKAEGKSILLITHKLKEIKAIADRCSVLRRGKLIGTVDVAQTNEAEMARMMVGREVFFVVDKQPFNPGDTVLKVENLSVINNRKVLGLKEFSLDVRAGEIMAVAGVEGNGQAELVEAITGLRQPESGSICLKGVDITTSNVRRRIRAGMAHIPEDRHKHGLVLDYTMEENLILELYDREPYARHGLLNFEEIRRHAQQVMNDFDVRAGRGIQTLARSMSGGNQQKAIVGREIELNPDLLVAVQPTRGLDVGAIEYIHKRLIEQRDQGKAVLLVSLELDEILNIADRVAVVCRGELIGVLDVPHTDENEIGLMMTGTRKEQSA